MRLHILIHGLRLFREAKWPENLLFTYLFYYQIKHKEVMGLILDLIEGEW